MKRLLPLATITFFMGSLVSGCGGVVVEPNKTVASLTLSADEHGGLLADACVAKFGKTGCTPYPNQLACDSMVVDISANGDTRLSCKKAGAVIQAGLATLADGSPFMCKADGNNSCQVCHDLYGNVVHDSCNRGTALFRGKTGGWSASPDGYAGAAVGGDPNDVEDPKSKEPEPKTGGTFSVVDECNPEMALDNYAREINAIMAAEGLGLSWSPDYMANKVTKDSKFMNKGQNRFCEKWLNRDSHLTKCWNTKDQSKCHCKTGHSGGDDGTKYNQTCRCARINVFALRAACKQVPDHCENKNAHVANLAAAYGAATQWLFHGTYGKNNYYGSAVTKGGENGDPFIPGDTPSVKAPRCLGSPLVFDLGNNGVAPSSLEKGVRFDLMTSGSLRTAWIQGDDALLVLDRNGNGTIDSGNELFGSATHYDGVPADDGFDALAQLDSPALGGNGNGVVEAADLLFAELRLWQDRNGDGVSQQAELSTLADAKVRGIEIRPNVRDTNSDAFGNDLGLRGAFTKEDGQQGLVIDVFFVTGR